MIATHMFRGPDVNENVREPVFTGKDFMRKINWRRPVTESLFQGHLADFSGFS